VTQRSCPRNPADTICVPPAGANGCRAGTHPERWVLKGAVALDFRLSTLTRSTTNINARARVRSRSKRETRPAPGCAGHGSNAARAAHASADTVDPETPPAASGHPPKPHRRDRRRSHALHP